MLKIFFINLSSIQGMRGVTMNRLSPLSIIIFTFFTLIGARFTHAEDLRSFYRIEGNFALDYQNINSADPAKKNVGSLDAQIDLSDDGEYCSITFTSTKHSYKCYSGISFSLKPSSIPGSCNKIEYVLAFIPKNISSILLTEFKKDALIVNNPGGLFFGYYCNYYECNCKQYKESSTVQLHTKKNWESYHLTFIPSSNLVKI